MVSWFICLSIQTQLRLLMSAMLVPSIIIIFGSALHEQTEIINNTRTNLLQLADLLADKQQDVVFSTNQIGSALAKLPDVKKHNTSQLLQILTDRTSNLPFYSGIIIADRNGKVTASIPRQKKPASIANRKSFINAKTSRIFSSGNYTAQHLSNSTYINFAYPLTADDGSFNGVIDFEINRNIFNHYLKNSFIPDECNFTLVDHKGMILYSQLYPKLEGTPERVESFAMMQGGYDGGDYFSGPANDGLSQMMYFRKINLEHEKEPFMYVLVSKQEQKMLAKEERALLLNCLAVIVVVLFSFYLVSIIGKRSIADRIEIMEKASDRLAHGEMSVRVATKVIGGELGRLANSFDQMAGQLEQRIGQNNELIDELRIEQLEKKQFTEKLLKNEKILETLINASLESTFLLTVNGTIEITNEIFAKRLGLNADEILGKNIFDLLPPEIVSYRRQQFELAVSSGNPVTFEDKRNNLDFMHSIVPVIDQRGEVTHLAVHCMDISLRKQFENELSSTNLKLQGLNQSIENTREEERQHLARDLHDQMGQALTGMSLDLNWLIAQLDQKLVDKLSFHITSMHITVESLIAMVRNITARLSPPLLANLGLATAIGHYVQEFERKSGTVCHLMLDEDVSVYFDNDESLAIFRIVQEALTNVARHAEADEVAISLCRTSKTVILEVADNGKGSSDEELEAPDAFGVLGMQERARKCGGKIFIQGNPGCGTIVRLEIPREIGGV